MDTIIKIINRATGLVWNRWGSAARTPAKGDAITLYRDTGSNDQRFIMEYWNGGPYVIFRLASNPELVINRSKVDGSLMLWPLTLSTERDILFNTHTTADGKRLLMPAHGLYAAAKALTSGANITTRAEDTSGNQYFELVDAAEGSGNTNSGASTVPGTKTLDIPCTLQKPYGNSYCYACGVLDISKYLHPSQKVTMETLIAKGCVRRASGYVDSTRPYFAATQTCIGASEGTYCAAITEQINLGMPVVVKLSKNGSDHFVVAVSGGASANAVMVNDPMLGRVTLRAAMNRKGQAYQHIRTITKL